MTCTSLVTLLEQWCNAVEAVFPASLTPPHRSSVDPSSLSPTPLLAFAVDAPPPLPSRRSSTADGFSPESLTRLLHRHMVAQGSFLRNLAVMSAEPQAHEEYSKLTGFLRRELFALKGELHKVEGNMIIMVSQRQREWCIAHEAGIAADASKLREDKVKAKALAKAYTSDNNVLAGQLSMQTEKTAALLASIDVVHTATKLSARIDAAVYKALLHPESNAKLGPPPHTIKRTTLAEDGEKQRRCFE